MVVASPSGRRARSAVAAITAALLIVVGLLGASHESEVAHVRDLRGELVHAHAPTGHHESGPTAHFHGREDHGHAAGACALAALAHTAGLALRPPAGVALAAALIGEVASIAPAAPRAVAAYRIAPKTSPPARG